MTAQALRDGEAAAQESRDRYRSIVERLPDVVWGGGADGRFTFVTPNVEAMLGSTPEEFCAPSWEERLQQIHPDDRARVDQAWRRVVDHDEVMDIEYQRLHKDGRWIWIRNRMLSNSPHEGGRRIEGMISDITERRRLERSVVEAQKMEALGQLTGGIAHDFNNLLAAILANTDFLVEELGANDPRREYADEIRVAAERAAGLTRQLLAFGRRQVMEPFVIDLNSIVVGLEKMLHRVIGEDIALVTRLVPGPGTARVDVGQLEQVILNLVVNARDAMSAGGTVTIETRNEAREVVLSVTDTGTGMDAETQRRIFEPFFTTKAPGKGTGLGLSTCYGIVHQSGGRISVDSAPGRGTRFVIALPRVDGPRPARSPTSEHHAQGTETILLIEDDERVRRAIVRILEPQGYRVLVARNGAEALALAQDSDRPIELVLSDVVMPGLSGPAVVAQLRELGRAPRTLFMSGYTHHETLDRDALEHRGNFLQKPFAPRALLKKVREILDGAGDD